MSKNYLCVCCGAKAESVYLRERGQYYPVCAQCEERCDYCHNEIKKMIRLEKREAP